jgi:hypothetical protein
VEKQKKKPHVEASGGKKEKQMSLLSYFESKYRSKEDPFKDAPLFISSSGAVFQPCPPTKSRGFLDKKGNVWMAHKVPAVALPVVDDEDIIFAGVQCSSKSLQAR